MKSLESMIGDGEAAREFWDDCIAAFGDPQGQRLLARLCSFIDPLSSPMGGTSEETHVGIGRREVVAALWRRSQPAILPSDAPPLLSESYGRTDKS